MPFLVFQAPTLVVTQPVDGTTYGNGAIAVEGTTTNAKTVTVTTASSVRRVESGPATEPPPTAAPAPTAKPGASPGAGPGATPEPGTTVDVDG